MTVAYKTTADNNTKKNFAVVESRSSWDAIAKEAIVKGIAIAEKSKAKK